MAIGQSRKRRSSLRISWLAHPDPSDRPPEPPELIPYLRPELLGGLTERDWSVMLEVLELVKRPIPTNSASPPSEVFEVIRKALQAHFREGA